MKINIEKSKSIQIRTKYNSHAKDNVNQQHDINNRITTESKDLTRVFKKINMETTPIT